MSPEISIIMPVYNSQSFLKQAITSALNQTYKNFELIIINDCSTDNSGEIIKKVRSRDNRIIYLELNHNSGQAIARNKGLDIARGKYICFLDSDDIWFPDKLSTELKFIQSHHLDFVYEYYDMIYENNRLKKHMTFLPRVITYKKLLTTNPVLMSTSMIKRSIIGGNRFPVVPCEDYAFWLLMFRKYNIKNHLFPEIHIGYRVRRNSDSGNKFISCERVWNLYRKQEQLNIIESILFIFIWAVKGSIKHQNVFK